MKMADQKFLCQNEIRIRLIDQPLPPYPSRIMALAGLDRGRIIYRTSLLPGRNASGSIIDQRSGYTVVLTAAHVCSSERLAAVADQLGVESGIKAQCL